MKTAESAAVVGGHKRLKWEEEAEDRLSALPDSLIQHILSFLPSTKQAVQTETLSKQWLNQWTLVPVLVFDSTGKSDKNFSRFIDRTLMLHDCSKIKKLQIRYDHHLGSDPELASKIRFAIRKHVEELSLHLHPLGKGDELDPTFSLPKFLFSNASLVKLELFRCYFTDKQSVDWPNLKELRLDCSRLHHQHLGNMLAGCPVLEFSEITNWTWHPGALIASESLKKLSFVDIKMHQDSGHFLVSCPNLEELRIARHPEFSITQFPGKTIDSVLSRSPFLHTLELSGLGGFCRVAFASNSLKNLVLGKTSGFPELDISCPCLEVLKLCHFHPGSANYELFPVWKRFAMKLLRQIKHVKVLDIGSWFIQTLKAEEGSSSLFSNCKCLTLDGAYFDGHLPGIVSAIHCLPLLEKLDINFPLHQSGKTVACSGLNDCRNLYCSQSDGAVFNRSVSNLKTVKIVGLSERYGYSKCVFNLVEFILKNGSMLEKIVVMLADCGERFCFEVSKKLLSLPRGCSPMATIELCSTCSNM